jgi:hypothetical protein
MAPVRPSIVLGYTGLMTLAESIEAAGSLDKEAVLKQLSIKTFKTPVGELAYGKSDGGALHQLPMRTARSSWPVPGLDDTDLSYCSPTFELPRV